MIFFWKGLIVGLSVAAPVGPIGLLCIQRTLLQGRVFGFVSGLGAATADAIYAILAGFGLTVVANFMNAEQAWIRLVGGGLLCYLGVRSVLSPPAQQSTTSKNSGLRWNYTSVFLLTITNPMTILAFMAVFAALGVANSGHSGVNAVVTVVGVFSGSAIWWFSLSGSVSLVRRKLNASLLRWINRVSGAVITTFGVVGIWSSGLV